MLCQRCYWKKQGFFSTVNRKIKLVTKIMFFSICVWIIGCFGDRSSSKVILCWRLICRHDINQIGNHDLMWFGSDLQKHSFMCFFCLFVSLFGVFLTFKKIHFYSIWLCQISKFGLAVWTQARSCDEEKLWETLHCHVKWMTRCAHPSPIYSLFSSFDSFVLNIHLKEYWKQHLLIHSF